MRILSRMCSKIRNFSDFSQFLGVIEEMSSELGHGALPIPLQIVHTR